MIVATEWLRVDATVVGLILTVAALLIALYQFRQASEQTAMAREQTDHLSAQTRRLEEHTSRLDAVGDSLTDTETKLLALESSLSTRFIGQFPHYLDDLARMIDKSRRTVEVLCAFPEHAHFSAPTSWCLVEEAIARKLADREVQVVMVFNDAASRMEADRIQFREAQDDFPAWRAAHRAELAEYIRSHAVCAREFGLDRNAGPAPEDWSEGLRTAEDWHQFQELCEQHAIRRWMGRDGGATILECERFLPVFAWIVDGEEAIFTLMGYGDALGFAIHSMDKGVVDAVASVVKRYQTDQASRRAEPQRAIDAVLAARARLPR